jgi:hypothetical protein
MAREREQSKASDVDRTGLSERGKQTLAMLTALEDEDKLSQWEQDFVASVTDKYLGKAYPLSEKQYECLEKIYNKFN